MSVFHDQSSFTIKSFHLASSTITTTTKTMKFQINLFVTAGMLAFASARSDANANAKSRGQAKKFQTSGSNADVELCEEEDCPKFNCPLNSGNGPNNAHWCQSESKSTSMTVVDADCADGSTGCTAASIVEGDTGRVWNKNPDGSVEVIEQADFPDEGKHKLLTYTTNMSYAN